MPFMASANCSDRVFALLRLSAVGGEGALDGGGGKGGGLASTGSACAAVNPRRGEGSPGAPEETNRGLTPKDPTGTATRSATNAATAPRAVAARRASVGANFLIARVDAIDRGSV